MKKLILLSWLVCFSAIAQTVPYATQCSANPQAAKLNELKTQGGGVGINFVEVLIMGVNVDISNWEVDYADKNSVNYVRMGQGNGLVYNGNGGLLGADGPGGAGTVFSYPAFVSYSITPMNSQWGEIILRDTTANRQIPPVPGLLDYLSYTTDISCTAHQWQIPAGGCVSPAASCVPWSSSNADISRPADGTGSWTADPPNSPTSSGSNAGAMPPGQKMLLNFSFFPNSGSFCTYTPTQITIQARDVSGAVKTDYTGTVNLVTTSGIGNGSYTFALSDAGQKIIALTDPDPENITLTATDSLIAGTASTSSVMGFHHCFGGFDAYETATPAGSITGVIKTRIAANAIALDIIALNQAGNAIDTGFSGNVRVELIGNTTLGVPQDEARCPTSYTILQSSTQHIANGRSSVNLAAVADAWRDVRVRIGFPSGSPSVVSCSSDNFAIRPASLGNVSATDSDWASAGSSRTLNNLAAAGGVVHRAGRPFTLQATARNSVGAITSNYAGSPAVKTLDCTLPAACANGTLAPGAFGGSGTVSSSTSSYSEAGTFTLTLEDQTFASVDSADSTPAERTIPQSPAPVSLGRFVPDHFTLTAANVPQLLTFNDASCSSRSFTYIGQPFGYLALPQTLVSARNYSGGTTVNYSGNLWKLSSADVTQNYSSTPALDTSLVGIPVVVSNSNGTGTVTPNSADKLVYPRSDPANSFNAAIALGVNVSDASENQVAGNGTITAAQQALFDGGGSGIPFDAGNQFLYGRLIIPNANGSELSSLPIAMETQYWSGSGFLTNSADNCTLISTGNFSLSNYQKNLGPGETAVGITGRVNGGKSNLTLSAPGLGNSGSVDICADLDAVSGGGDASCQAPSPANLSFLQGRWSGTLYDKDPKGRATFGIYRNVNEFIYFRENY